MNRFDRLKLKPGWQNASDKASLARKEILRRTALAREPRPQGVSGPPLRLLLGELGTLASMLRFRAAPVHHAARPRPVMVLPGFGAHPLRMLPMLRALRAAGHEAFDWGMGINLGPTAENFAFLTARIERLARLSGEPVALVGWSLGGLFAREIAKAAPHAVSMVITLGTPFSGNPRANNAWRAYQFVTGHRVDEPPIEGDFAAKPPVPTIALWSPRDGVIAPRSARGQAGERDLCVALRCSHLAFASDPAVLGEVLRQLDHDWG